MTQINPLWHLWLVTLTDGRRAEVAALTRREAAEQAGAVWGIPAAWLLSNASFHPVLPGAQGRAV